MENTTEVSKGVAHPSITRTRFNKIKECLITDTELDEDTISLIMQIFCKVLNYDPNAKCYSDANLRATRAYRQKLKEKKST